MQEGHEPLHHPQVISLDTSAAHQVSATGHYPWSTALPRSGYPARPPCGSMGDPAASAGLARVPGDAAPPGADLGAVLRLVHSPLAWEPSAWRGAVSRSLKALMGADAVACLFWQDGELETVSEGVAPDTIAEYLERFGAVDYGMHRRDALGLGLWSRQLLWERDALMRSTYFNEFARPRAIHDSVGLSVDLDDVSAHLRIVLLYCHGPLWPDHPDDRLAPLEPVLPALRTAIRLQVGLDRWLHLTASLMDKTGERLMLFTLEGRELYRSARLRRLLEEDPCREQLLATMRSTARAVAGVTRTSPPVRPEELHRLEGTRQEARGATGRYRARACLLGPGVVGPDTVVLVTMHRTANDLPPGDLLHSRYGLTRREIEVARLLAQRMTNREIAGELGISAHTARHHTESVLLKTQVSSRRSLRRLLTDEP